MSPWRIKWDGAARFSGRELCLADAVTQLWGTTTAEAAVWGGSQVRAQAGALHLRDVWLVAMAMQLCHSEFKTKEKKGCYLNTIKKKKKKGEGRGKKKERVSLCFLHVSSSQAALTLLTIRLHKSSHQVCQLAEACWQPRALIRFQFVDLRQRAGDGRWGLHLLRQSGVTPWGITVPFPKRALPA